MTYRPSHDLLQICGDPIDTVAFNAAVHPLPVIYVTDSRWKTGRHDGDCDSAGACG